MLYWHFRNIQCIFAALFRPRLKSPLEIVTKTFIANPFDSDWMRSVQAGRFFTYTDAGRWEIAVRVGFLHKALFNRWVVIIGGQKIINRKPLRIFRSFNLTMRFVGWDDKWVYAVHRFTQAGELKAVSFTKLGIRGVNGILAPSEAFKKMGYDNEATVSERILRLFKDDLGILEDDFDTKPITI